MKKLALLFGSAVLALTSCTKDDVSEATPILLKTITNGDKITTLTYNGNKIVTVGTSETYFYTGDLISKKEIKYNGFTTNIDYSYENGKLTSEATKRNSGEGTELKPIDKRDYVYNTDGTVTAKKYAYQNGTPAAVGTSKISFENGNIVRIEDFNASGTSTGSGFVYEYDNKINPLNHIKGYDKLFDANYSSKNNFSKSIETNTTSGSAVTFTTTRVFTYNDQGYPINVQSTSAYNIQGSTPTTSTRVYAY